MAGPHVFAGSTLDRASAVRRDADWLQARLEAAESRFLAFWRLDALVTTDDPPALAWARGSIRGVLEGASDPILLGLDHDVAHFAVDVSALEKPEVDLGVVGAARFTEVRSVAARLSASDAGVLAHGRSLVDWHASHRFCAVCGGATRSADAGYMRVCSDCAAEHFPRTNPVVIMLVHRGDRCLLGRQGGWPAGFFSALAGFVEPGETIESAVRREVAEEAGIEIGEVTYHSSQPWPFPSSLMIGCLAEGLSEEIRLDDELESAGWFTRDEIRRAFAEPGRGAGFFLPPAMAIAHQLIRAWAEG